MTMFDFPDFSEIYDSYHNGHKIYTYNQLIKTHPKYKTNAYMFINSDDYDKFVIGKELESPNLWFTTKTTLQSIQINNMEKDDVLYVVSVGLCENAHFNKSPENIITTNKIIVKEIKQAKVVKKFIVLD